MPIVFDSRLRGNMVFRFYLDSCSLPSQEQALREFCLPGEGRTSNWKTPSLISIKHSPYKKFPLRNRLLRFFPFSVKKHKNLESEKSFHLLSCFSFVKQEGEFQTRINSVYPEGPNRLQFLELSQVKLFQSETALS